MKSIIKYLSLIFIPVVLVSCSLSFGGMVALDNSFSEDSKEIDLNELSELKQGNKIIFELMDSSMIQGVFEGYKETTVNNQNEIMIKVLNNEDELKFIDAKEVSRCIFIKEDGNVWVAVAIGATIDAIIIYLASTSKVGLGGTPVFR